MILFNLEADGNPFDFLGKIPLHYRVVFFLTNKIMVWGMKDM